MPTVPQYQRQVSPRPILQQSITTRATPSAFGADIARGVGNVGESLSQASQAMAAVRDMEDVVRAKEADDQLAAWTRDKMYGDGGFMTLEGKAAVDGRDAFAKAWEEKRRSLGSALTGGAAQKYTTASNARKDQVMQTVMVKAADARKQWFRDSSAARLQTFTDDAQAAFADPKKVTTNIAAGQAELRQQAQLEGWDADTLASKEAAFMSNIHKGVAMRIAQDDPIAAKRYVDEHVAQITGGDQLTLENSLHDAVKDATAKQEAARIMAMVDSGKPVDIDAELKGIKDDDVRILTDNRINALVAAESSASKAQTTAAKSQLWDIINKGGTPDDAPFDVKQAAGLDAVSSAWSFVQARNTRAVPKSDQALLYKLRRQAAEDPEGFADLDLNDFRSTLSPDDVKELTEKQTSAISDTRKAHQHGATYSSAFALADHSLESIGLTTTGKTGADRDAAAQKIGQFQNALGDLLDEYVKKEGRTPSDEEVQGMVNKLLLPIVIKSPKNRFDLFDMSALFGGSNEAPGYLFQAGTRPDGSSVEVRANYADIPIDLRNGIASDLERELGRKPSPEEVTDRYEQFILTQ